MVFCTLLQLLHVLFLVRHASDNLIDPVLSNFIDLPGGLINYVRCYFADLIDNVPTSISKIIPVEKAPSLPLRLSFFASSVSPSLWVGNFFAFLTSAAFLPPHNELLDVLVQQRDSQEVRLF